MARSAPIAWQFDRWVLYVSGESRKRKQTSWVDVEQCSQLFPGQGLAPAVKTCIYILESHSYVICIYKDTKSAEKNVHLLFYQKDFRYFIASYNFIYDIAKDVLTT